MNYFIIILINCIYFSLANLMPVYGAWRMSVKLSGSSRALRTALFLFLYLFQAAVNFSISGAIGHLSLFTGIFAGIVTGFTLALCAKKIPRQEGEISPEPLSKPAFSLIVFSVTLVIFFIRKASILPGTDTYLYHLYFPAMWLQKGEIFAVSMAGLPHEYFPVCGETMFGWMMMTGENLFVSFVQPLAFGMAISGIYALWEMFDIPRIHIAAGIFLCATCGIIAENAGLCYTDLLTGSFLASGICFLLISQKISGSDRGKSLIIGVIAGLSMGIAAAVKYSGLVFAPPVTLLLLIFFYCKNPEGRRAAWMTAGSAIVAAGAYYMPNFIKTGNPFYPVRIPGIFNNGFEFERDTIPFKNMWSFFVNDNTHDMNIFSAVIYIALIIGVMLLLFKKFRVKNSSAAMLALYMLAIFTVTEIVMLVIYPAMTQARQIIPFLMALSILFPPVLNAVAGNAVSSIKSRYIYLAVLLIAGFFNLCNHNSLIFVLTYLLFMTVSILIVIPEKKRIRKILFTICLLICSGRIIHCWQVRHAAALNGVLVFGGRTAYDVAAFLRRETQDKCQKIASAGSWYNYMLMLDMPGNEVVYIPVNKQNTTHPHEVADITDLRTNPVSYQEWKQRLHDAGCTFLIVDLKSRQDFFFNPRLELDWALNNPQDFKLLTNDPQIFFFQIIDP